MATKLKIEKRGDAILIVHCCFSICQNELKIMSDSPCPPFKMAAIAKNRNFFNGPLLLYYKPNSSNFNCSYMAMSSLTYIPGFSVKFFFQLIYTDYANWAYFDKRSHLNLLL
jgi:hypothetical protein